MEAISFLQHKSSTSITSSETAFMIHFSPIRICSSLWAVPLVHLTSTKSEPVTFYGETFVFLLRATTARCRFKSARSCTSRCIISSVFWRPDILADLAAESTFNVWAVAKHLTGNGRNRGCEGRITLNTSKGDLKSLGFPGFIVLNISNGTWFKRLCVTSSIEGQYCGGRRNSWASAVRSRSTSVKTRSTDPFAQAQYAVVKSWLVWIFSVSYRINSFWKWDRWWLTNHSILLKSEINVGNAFATEVSVEYLVYLSHPYLERSSRILGTYFKSEDLGLKLRK